MPSSMIFASLVVLWLLILVPAVARHRQEVARPSVAALSGRVLARSPRRRSQEVDVMVERDETVGRFPYLNAKADYSRPINPNSKIETGLASATAASCIGLTCPRIGWG